MKKVLTSLLVALTLSTPAIAATPRPNPIYQSGGYAIINIVLL